MILSLKSGLILLTCLLISFSSNSQSEIKTVYMIPGQGSDYRIFKNFSLENVDTVHIKYIIPYENEKMEDYAKRLSAQIDNSKRFSLIGVSMGGMICVEMSEFLNPEEVIIISSAKNREELPYRYKFMKDVPLNTMFNGSFLLAVAPAAQMIVEPDSRNESELCMSMLKNKNELFMKYSVNMIINWDRISSKTDIIHIHGDNDHTIPIRNIKDPTVIIKKGSHMMTLTGGDELSEIIQSFIE